MRLTEVFQMDEEKIVAVLRNGQNAPIYKNPTLEELNKIGMNGVVKGILTPSNFIGFDFNNVSLRDLPPITGYPIILYVHSGKNASVELFHHVNIPQEDFEKLVATNQYLRGFSIQQVIWHKNEA
jgi:hypothetical protein